MRTELDPRLVAVETALEHLLEAFCRSQPEPQAALDAFAEAMFESAVACSDERQKARNDDQAFFLDRVFMETSELREDLLMSISGRLAAP